MGFIINPYLFAAATDADADSFISAAGITDSTQQSAIQTLVTDLKGYGIWTKMKAIYPMVGGTSTTHKYNLKDPQDTDAAFRLVFSGGWTHSSTGALPNGTNAYADTKLNAQTHVNTTNHLSYYSRSSTVNTVVEMGAYDGASPPLFNQLRIAANYVAGSTDAIVSFGSTSNAQGFWIGTKRSNTDREGYKNGTSDATNTSSDTNNLPSVNIWIGARNFNGSAELYSAKECAFASIGDGLTDTEAANFYTAVQAFNTTLSRNV